MEGASMTASDTCPGGGMVGGQNALPIPVPIPLNAHTKRTLIWTPDASRGMGLIGNTPDAYGQTWHLPTDPERLTYAQMIEVALDVSRRRIRYTTVPEIAFKVGGWFNPAVKEASELLPRYRCDNIFDSSKFTNRYPTFRVTTYREGIAEILNN